MSCVVVHHLPRHDTLVQFHTPLPLLHITSVFNTLYNKTSGCIDQFRVRRYKFSTIAFHYGVGYLIPC